MPKGKLLKYKTPDALHARGMEYINKRKSENQPILYSGLLLHLDLANSTFNEYEARESYTDVVKKLKLEVQAYAEEKLYSGKSPIAGIFVLRNFGWQEEQAIGGNSGTITIKWASKKPLSKRK